MTMTVLKMFQICNIRIINFFLKDIAPYFKLPTINFVNQTEYYVIKEEIKKNDACNFHIVWYFSLLFHYQNFLLLLHA